MVPPMPPVIYRTKLSRGGVGGCFLVGGHLLYRTDIIYRMRSVVHHRAIIHGISFRGFNIVRFFNAKWSPLFRLHTSNQTGLLSYLSPSTKQNGHECGIDEYFNSTSFTVSGNTTIVL
jgi:hypothetical protein